MTVAAPTAGPITVEGVPLKIRLRRAERMRKLKAIGLILPLFLFLIFTFVLPIGFLLALSVQNPEIRTVLPRTTEALRAWDGEELPGPDVLVPFTEEVKTAKENRSIARTGKRLNYDITGYRSLMLKTAKKVSKWPADIPPGELLQRYIDIDKRWAESHYWGAMKKAAEPVTSFYLWAALDRDVDIHGNITLAPEIRRLYLDVLERTFWISFIVTLICLVLAYPVAYLLATLPTGISNMLIILVLIPFWTSLLVRTTAWIVVLQTEGVLNDFAMAIGVLPDRVQLIYNRTGVYVAMVHILLPFMILPIFSVMKGISPSYMRAAASLGAGPFRSFRKVYFPQTLPGIGAGCLLVFIVSLGYYITPALVGGPGDQMTSYLIYFFVNRSVNWGMAGALSVVLLTCVIVFYWLYNRYVGIERMKLG